MKLGSLRVLLAGLLVVLAAFFAMFSFIYLGYAVVPRFQASLVAAVGPTPTATATSTPTATPTPRPAVTPTPVPTPAYSYSELRIDAGKTVRHRVNGVRRGQAVEGYFRDLQDNDINFWIEDPAGRKVNDAGRVRGRHDFVISAREEGAYSLVFDLSYTFFSGRTIALYWRAY